MRSIGIEPFLNTVFHDDALDLLGAIPTGSVDAVITDAMNGTAMFTSGQDCVNHLDPAGDVQVDVITVDDLLRGRIASGVKIDVEGHEMDVLSGCVESLASHRIGLLQIEWNRSSETAVGTDRTPVADLLAGFGYRLYRPTPEGLLMDAGSHPGYGPDVFAMRG